MKFKVPFRGFRGKAGGVFDQKTNRKILGLDL